MIAARPNVCIVQDREPQLTETFLRAHLERLPGNVIPLYGFIASEQGVTVRSQSLPRRAVRKALRIVTGAEYVSEATASYEQAFVQHHADVVLAEYGPTGVHVLEACRRANVPLVVHFHGYDASLKQVLAEQRDGYQALFHEAAAIVVVSQAMAAKIVNLGAPAEKVKLNCYGVDVERFQGARPADAPPVFVAVGRFTDKKAPQLTIAAFERVVRQTPEARLRMIGDGPLLDACRDLVAGLRLTEQVTLLGSQPADVIVREMRQARCFVQHSVVAQNGDAEGTPVAVLEAGAAGLPVVATRHAGIPDVVLDGETGLLVQERDVEGMARAMLAIATQPELAGRLGEAGQRRIAEHFTMEQSIAGLWSILTSCLRPAALPKTSPSNTPIVEATVNVGR